KRLLNDNHLLEVNQQPCVAHTLQLSVKEGLKQQAQRLRESQILINSANLLQDNGTISPLEVLTDCKTRLLEEMVKVLKPFKEITRHVCSAKYPTMNLVYPYIRILKNKYTPIAEKSESIESWLDLIYGSSIENSEQISDSNTSISSDDKANIL
ncbi:14914_t:CDS:2, partial [Gigaspora rosea]